MTFILSCASKQKGAKISETDCIYKELSCLHASRIKVTVKTEVGVVICGLHNAKQMLCVLTLRPSYV